MANAAFAIATGAGAQPPPQPLSAPPPCTSHPAPSTCTLQNATCPLHPTPCTPQNAPCILHPASHALSALHPTLCILPHAPCTPAVHPAAQLCTLQNVFCTLHSALALFSLHCAPFTQCCAPCRMQLLHVPCAMHLTLCTLHCAAHPTHLTPHNLHPLLCSSHGVMSTPGHCAPLRMPHAAHTAPCTFLLAQPASHTPHCAPRSQGDAGDKGPQPSPAESRLWCVNNCRGPGCGAAGEGRRGWCSPLTPVLAFPPQSQPSLLPAGAEGSKQVVGRKGWPLCWVAVPGPPPW